MKELTIAAAPENADTVVEFVDGLLEGYDCDMRVLMSIEVAVDEIFTNIANYSYNPGTGDATVRVEVTEDPLTADITFIDRGRPYDPLAREDPDTTLSVEERPIGGMGILIVKKSMDAVSYEYRDGMNILTIRKNIGNL